MGERHLEKTDGLVNSGDHGMSIASELAEREGLVFGGRYRAIKELGAGVGKRTLLAIDRARGETVVLKAHATCDSFPERIAGTSSLSAGGFANCAVSLLVPRWMWDATETCYSR